jgi:hypothetical protein
VGVTCSMHGDTRNSCSILEGQLDGKRPLGTTVLKKVKTVLQHTYGAEGRKGTAPTHS